MMAGWDFTANSDIQKDLAIKLNDSANEFSEKILEMYSHIDSLGSSWVGEDYNAFKSGTEGYKQSLQDLSDGIRLFSKHFESLSDGTQNLATILASIIQNATSNSFADNLGDIRTPVGDLPQTDGLSDQEQVLIIDPSSVDNTPSQVSNVSTSKKDINVDNVASGSRVASALDKYSSELDSAEYAKVNENIFMTITPTNVDGNNCYLTHVVINNPSQIFGEPANGRYASGLETATSAAKRLGTNTALVLNGSHFSYADGSEDLKGANYIVIVDGEIKTNGTAGGMEICLDKNGNLFNAPAGTSAQDLVDKGVVYTFSSHDSHLISNGTKTYEHQDGAYNSTVIGQKEACDYYILTGSTSNFGAADYLYDKGCTFAKSMDQGGSVSLVYNGQLINTPTDDSGERAIGDFLCISD